MRKPVYLLAGGRPRNPGETNSVLMTVMEESGITSPIIAYSGTANGDDTGFFRRMKDELVKAGAGNVIHAVIDSPGADLDKAAGILHGADMVFISGGDVDRGMVALQRTGMISLLRELFDSGKTFFGISAGAIMLAKKWVRWPDPYDTSSAELFPCLDFAPVIVDCHDEDSGWEELQAALSLETELETGYGLASGSGIRVSADGSVKALGSAVHRLVSDGGKVSRSIDLLPG
ncbi:MAG: Type 1 glutamine amidotransferase-like domain-containing protein [Dehalococcoidales bacterium]|nr:Type 1 glutamine amidotransferase-like domain-containing protein [Dehalococcoidales bacterium]